MARHLFIVSRETPYLADYMREQFAAEENVEVILDRRRGERRRPDPPPPDIERRIADRRQRPDVDQQVREAFHSLVTLD